MQAYARRVRWEAEVQAAALAEVLLGGGADGQQPEQPVKRISADALLGSMGINLG